MNSLNNILGRWSINMRNDIDDDRFVPFADGDAVQYDGGDDDSEYQQALSASGIDPSVLKNGGNLLSQTMKVSNPACCSFVLYVLLHIVVFGFAFNGVVKTIFLGGACMFGLVGMLFFALFAGGPTYYQIDSNKELDEITITRHTMRGAVTTITKKASDLVDITVHQTHPNKKNQDDPEDPRVFGHDLILIFKDKTYISMNIEMKGDRGGSLFRQLELFHFGGKAPQNTEYSESHQRNEELEDGDCKFILKMLVVELVIIAIMYGISQLVMPDEFRCWGTCGDRTRGRRSYRRCKRPDAPQDVCSKLSDW